MCVPSLTGCHPQNAVQQRALRVLKQKKLYEGQISQLQQQTFNMEQASLTTENLRNTMATVDAMKTANKEMRKQYGKIDIDKIEVRSSCLWVLAALPLRRLHLFAFQLPPVPFPLLATCPCHALSVCHR
jgi:hypothetical protein